MSVSEPENLGYFSGGVPAGTMFQLNLGRLRGIGLDSEGGRSELNARAELCLIGLVAYFEAFCKDHFASLVNICPALIDELRCRGRDVMVSASDLMALPEPTRHRLGFLLAERFSFGRSKSINSIYMDLLKRSPFSKDDAVRYDRLRSDRNLLVHHGGVFTARYAGQRFAKQSAHGRVHYDSLIVTEQAFMSASQLLEGVARKTITSTHEALEEFVRARQIDLSESARKAMWFLPWWE